MGKVEFFVGSKSSGALLLHVDVLNVEGEAHDNDLVIGFLNAVNSFAKDMGWPGGVSMIRSGSLECRLAAGNFVFSALIIDNPSLVSTNSMLESYISSIASDIADKFEKKYKTKLEEGEKSHIYGGNDFDAFKDEILNTIDKFGEEIKELYYKLILIDALYSHVPSKWCVPLISKASERGDLTKDFDDLIEKYPHFKKVIWKTNNNFRPIWEIFAVPMYDAD